MDYGWIYGVSVHDALLVVCVSASWSNRNFVFFVTQKRRKRREIAKFCIAAGTALIVLGSGWTTWKELKTAPYRKEYLQISREVGLHYRTASEEDLETYLHSSAEDVRAAMKILEENKLNIFR